MEFENNLSDSELNVKKYRRSSWIHTMDAGVKLRSNSENFTPFTKIPAIGEKIDPKTVPNRLGINNWSTSPGKTSRGASSKIPIFRSQSVNKDGAVKSGDLKPRHLVRRNTYVVLEPVKSDTLHGRSLKDIDNNNNNLSKNKGVNNSKEDLRNADLSTLNYLFHNLKLSRNTQSNLFLPKNNPWLF
ncbi:hypothetical protein FQA39_LY14128 [Lamprigera yunnana]|nr:hypothetical protein FQA39_LY14128 [Lamprigera yunnana]